MMPLNFKITTKVTDQARSPWKHRRNRSLFFSRMEPTDQRVWVSKNNIAFTSGIVILSLSLHSLYIVREILLGS